MKVHVGVEVQLHAFVTSVLFGSEWSGSFMLCVTSCYHWVKGFMGPTAILDDAEKRKCYALVGIRTPVARSSIPSLY
jgi:hypothetical protein